MGYSEPARSVALLNELVRLGLSDEAFGIIHHFGSKERISAHLRYCTELAESRGRFSAKTNQDTQRRMEIVLRAYLAGGFRTADGRIFVALAQAALVEIPLEK
jgi:hypothetical protein